MDLPDFDPYRELEVDASASLETIEAAYKSLMKRHHPDKGAVVSAQRAKRLNIARDWLTDPVRRATFDQAVGGLAPKRRSQGRRNRKRPTRGDVAGLGAIGAFGLALTAWSVAMTAPEVDMLPVVVLGLAIAVSAAAGLLAIAGSRWGSDQPDRRP
jgi:curved DNA-binding protein CbpA